VSTTEEAQFDADNQLPTGKKRGRIGRRQKADGDGVHHTRIGNAWVAVAVAAVLGVALIDFIVQNTRSVRIEFFSATGHIPVAVALLGAALAGAVLVLAVGIARTTQLRIANRRGKKREARAAREANSGA
jgi:putative membrane protein